jgi:hypothetical protein
MLDEMQKAKRTNIELLMWMESVLKLHSKSSSDPLCVADDYDRSGFNLTST